MTRAPHCHTSGNRGTSRDPATADKLPRAFPGGQDHRTSADHRAQLAAVGATCPVKDRPVRQRSQHGGRGAGDAEEPGPAAPPQSLNQALPEARLALAFSPHELQVPVPDCRVSPARATVTSFPAATSAGSLILCWQWLSGRKPGTLRARGLAGNHYRCNRLCRLPTSEEPSGWRVHCISQRRHHTRGQTREETGSDGAGSSWGGWQGSLTWGEAYPRGPSRLFPLGASCAGTCSPEH